MAATDTGDQHVEATPSSPAHPDRSAMDRLVRQVLLIEDASPRAMFELRGSMLLAGVRCTVTYALVPLLAPAVAWFGVLATPLSLLLSVTAIVMAINSLRRVWWADYRHRWAYSAFIVTAVTLLVVVVVGDVHILVG